MAALAETRLVTLAAAASNGAAATARLELYPRGLDTVRALRLAQSALVGARNLGADDVAQRVKARYPQAAPLPGRPALDRLLTDAGIELVWDVGAGDGSGAYVAKAARLAGLGSSTSRISRHTTVGAQLVGDDDATRLEHRLKAAAHAGGFMALTVEPRLYERAATELERFGTHRVSVEELLLRHLHTKAEEVRAAWDVVVAADAAGPGSRDWSRLLTLVRAAIPAVEADLRDAGDRMVVSELGPLARYGAMHVLEREGRMRRTRRPTPSLSGRPKPHLSWCTGPRRTQRAEPYLGRRTDGLPARRCGGRLDSGLPRRCYLVLAPPGEQRRRRGDDGAQRLGQGLRQLVVAQDAGKLAAQLSGGTGFGTGQPEGRLDDAPRGVAQGSLDVCSGGEAAGDRLGGGGLERRIGHHGDGGITSTGGERLDQRQRAAGGGKSTTALRTAGRVQPPVPRTAGRFEPPVGEVVERC